MEMHQLRYVCAVADTGSFTRAAERENISQPSLSQQIIKLESELKVHLFDRVGRAARITGAGQVFLNRARQILEELNAAKEELSAKQRSGSGPVALGVIPTIGPYFLPPLMKNFCSQYPQASISMFEEPSPKLLERLRSGLLDMAVVALPIRSQDLLCVPLYTERLFAVVPSGHKLAARPQVFWPDLRNQPFLLLRDHQRSRNGAIELWGQNRVVPRVIFETGQLRSILALVGAGAGISIVPRIATQPRDDCSFLPIAEEGAILTIGIVLRKEHFLTGVQQAFLNHLQSWQANQPKSGNKVHDQVNH